MKMKEEIFEASLTPEKLKQMRGEAVITGEGVSAYGPLDRSFEALKTNMKSPRFDNERMWNLLRGSYDIHVHSGPSSTTHRLYDELDLAPPRLLCRPGGIVFKNHNTPSTRSVKIVQTHVPDQWI